MRWSCLQFNVLLLPESYRRLSAETRGKPLYRPHSTRPGGILENNTQSNTPRPPYSRLGVGVRQRLGGVTRVPQSSNPEPYELSCLVVVVHQHRLRFSVQVRGGAAAAAAAGAAAAAAAAAAAEAPEAEASRPFFPSKTKQKKARFAREPPNRNPPELLVIHTSHIHTLFRYRRQHYVHVFFSYSYTLLF